MKILQLRLFIPLVILLIQSSCTIEKRVHMSGYRVEWNKPRQILESKKLAVDDASEAIKPEIYRSDLQETASRINLEKSTFSSAMKEDKIESVSSQDSHQIQIPNPDQKVDLPALSESELKLNTIISNEKSLNKKLAIDPEREDGGSAALRVIGWFVLIIGLIILLFASLIVGILLMLLGLVFVLSGGKKKKKNHSDNSEFIDVVYLKNGSIIRGIIIEQVPNVSLKIQTKDKSIFVYKMDEVEKITKELSN